MEREKISSRKGSGPLRSNLFTSLSFSQLLRRHSRYVPLSHNFNVFGLFISRYSLALLLAFVGCPSLTEVLKRTRGCYQYLIMRSRTAVDISCSLFFVIHILLRFLPNNVVLLAVNHWYLHIFGIWDWIKKLDSSTNLSTVDVIFRTELLCFTNLNK